MATAVPINLTVEQGADFAVEFNLRTDNGAFQNLAGYTAEAFFARNYTTSNRYSFATSIESETSGLIRLSLSRNITVTGTNQPATKDLKAGRYVWNLFLTDSLSSKSKVLEGVITVDPAVIR